MRWWLVTELGVVVSWWMSVKSLPYMCPVLCVNYISTKLDDKKNSGAWGVCQEQCLHLSQSSLREMTTESNVLAPQGRLCWMCGLPSWQQADVKEARSSPSWTSSEHLSRWGELFRGCPLEGSRAHTHVSCSVPYMNWYIPSLMCKVNSYIGKKGSVFFLKAPGRRVVRATLPTHWMVCHPFLHCLDEPI